MIHTQGHMFGGWNILLREMVSMQVVDAQYILIHVGVQNLTSFMCWVLYADDIILLEWLAG